jgi:hypothetical protein
MYRKFLALPLAAALALALGACGRDEDRAGLPSNPELPRTAQAPANADRPAAGTQLNPDTSDPSIPQDPTNRDPEKKDSSPPPGASEPPLAKSEG